MTDAILAALIMAPVVTVLLLKSNAALGFLALCLGFVLSTSVIGDLKRLLSETNLSVTSGTLAIILLAMPLALTLLFSRKSGGHGLRAWLQLAVALCAGGLLALSIAPLINTSWFDLKASKIWDPLDSAQSIVIGAGALLSLALVWLGGKSKSHPKKHR